MEQLLRDLNDARKATAFGLLRRREQYDAPYVRGEPKFVANLWTEFAAQHGEALATNGKKPQNP